ncbi:hypothetical protein ADL03_26170 [Nocardia sp. NRRL S-836]|nr:hypothetical protein ADL03_26170 [Nocardia sp. NRRL S-836]
MVAAAVLCLAVAVAQPASAAWQTSSAGPAGAKGGLLADVTGVACTATTISWTAVIGATGYNVSWSDNAGNGNSNFTTPVRVTGTSYAVSGGGVKRARVQALAGTTWASAVIVKVC